MATTRKKTQRKTTPRRRATAAVSVGRAPRRRSRTSTNMFAKIPEIVFAIIIVRFGINVVGDFVKKNFGSAAEEYSDVLLPLLLYWLDRKLAFKLPYVKEVTTYMASVGIADLISGKISIPGLASTAAGIKPVGAMVNYPRPKGALASYTPKARRSATQKQLMPAAMSGGYRNLSMMMRK